MKISLIAIILTLLSSTALALHLPEKEEVFIVNIACRGEKSIYSTVALDRSSSRKLLSFLESINITGTRGAS